MAKSTTPKWTPTPAPLNDPKVRVALTAKTMGELVALFNAYALTKDRVKNFPDRKAAVAAVLRVLGQEASIKEHGVDLGALEAGSLDLDFAENTGMNTTPTQTDTPKSPLAAAMERAKAEGARVNARGETPAESLDRIAAEAKARDEAKAAEKAAKKAEADAKKAAKAAETEAKKAEREAAKMAKAAEAEAKKAEREAAKAAKAAEKGASKPRGNFPFVGDHKVVMLVDKNPKSRGAAERFSVYYDGITVDAAVAAGSTRADVIWDESKQFIQIVAPEAYEAAVAARDEARAARVAEAEAKAKAAAEEAAAKAAAIESAKAAKAKAEAEAKALAEAKAAEAKAKAEEAAAKAAAAKAG
jgi:hypothetical protein